MAKNLYVGNLSYETNEAKLRELFGEHGPVVSVNIITDQQTGRSKGFAFVEMETDQAASAAITALNEQEVDGRTLRVAEARPRGSSDSEFRGGRGDRPGRDRRGGGGRRSW